MNNSIEEYLQVLKLQLARSDRATVQDAMADAEEHLSNAVQALRQDNPEMDADLALEKAIEQYGNPEEIAAAYKEVERITFPSLMRPASVKHKTLLGRFFGIFVDPRAWGGILYMLISLVTGTVYFSWAVTGSSLSISLALFIFGLPLALLFLVSIRGIAVLEGRLVDSLLGIRMPRRPFFPARNANWKERLKWLVTDKHTWLSLLYMALQLPLGIFYFTLIVVLLTLSLALIAIPIGQYGFHIPIVQWGSSQIFLPDWSMPLVVLLSVLLWTITMHLAKLIGSLHGRFAKFMLVSE
jgi:hypothetical protein